MLSAVLRGTTSLLERSPIGQPCPPDGPPAPERDGYISSACGEDRDLRMQVETLLDAHDEADEFLASPTVAREGRHQLDKSLHSA